jgi:trimethylamine:corrinoid methyltransferase-like protein
MKTQRRGRKLETGPRAIDQLPWKQPLEEYQLPYLEPSRLEEIDAFVARRTAEGGEPTDF